VIERAYGLLKAIQYVLLQQFAKGHQTGVILQVFAVEDTHTHHSPDESWLADCPLDNNGVLKQDLQMGCPSSHPTNSVKALKI